MARATLYQTKPKQTWMTRFGSSRPDAIIARTARPMIEAMTRLDAGPASATASSPFRRSRRLFGLTGVGLAQPKTNPPPSTETTRRSPPIGSKWATGFSVSRPNNLAVASPRRYATSACEAS